MTVRYDTPHNEAFLELGAVKPSQHWSSFDVPRKQARRGKANLFVTTIWNFHSTKDSQGRRTPTEVAIVQDRADETFWYRMRKPPVTTTRLTAVAHWDGLQLALKTGIPIVGVLKDVHTGHCSLEQVFDCNCPRYEPDGEAVWLQLHPRGEIECEVRVDDVLKSTSESLEEWDQRFAAQVERASHRDELDRKRRLQEASPIARRVQSVTIVFERNADVVAEVLLRADGICEWCHQPAPFIRRSDGTPYLEVHHRIPLAEGGEDTVENAVALCPNCHRQAHYG